MSLISFYLSSILVVAAVSEPHSFTIIDFWQRKCDEGELAACAKMETNKRDEKKLAKLNSLASKFETNIVPEDFLLGKKPNLAKAYPIVIEGYLDAFEEQQNEKPAKFAIDYCAQHFHKYWLNQKYWWPTNINDEPDWGTIYVYIVDHYHGLCLKRPF
jgi:hypothetical protein